MKTKFEFEDIFSILMILIIVLGIIFSVTAIVKYKPDEVINETVDSIYVRKYNMFATDSKIVVYPQPKIYNGVVTEKNRVSSFHGVPGKGGHWQTHYKVTIEFNGKTVRYNSRYLYDKYEKGSNVKVKESWYNEKYGCYQIDIL